MKQNPDTLALVEEAKSNLTRNGAMILDDLVSAFPDARPAELLALTASAAAWYWMHMSPGFARTSAEWVSKRLPRNAAVSPHDIKP